MPDAMSLSEAEALSLAQELIDGGRPFHAHEVLEAVWKSSAGNDRELWRGLAQIAVGLTHARRGNQRGAAALLRRGADVVTSAPAGHLVDPASIGKAAYDLADRIERSKSDPLPAVALRIQLTGTPGSTQR